MKSYFSLFFIQKPFKVILLVFKWMIAELFIEFSRLQLWVSSHALPDSDLDMQYGDTDEEDQPRHPVSEVPKKPKVKQRKGSSVEDEEWFAMNEMRKKKNVTRYYPCDKKSELYVLQQDTWRDKTFSLDTVTNGSR